MYDKSIASLLRIVSDNYASSHWTIPGLLLLLLIIDYAH